VFTALLALAAATIASSAGAADDPYASRQWNMALVGAEQAWATATGNGITIAVLDTGVDLEHEDFGPGKLVPGRDFVDPGTAPDDEHGHGTHVAGIAAASTNNGRGVVGVAPGAHIMPVRVLSRIGVGLVDIDGAIRWAVDNGAQVINMSLGDALAGFDDDAPFTEALAYAWQHGVICVISAGNDPDLASPFTSQPVLVVTATDAADNRASYSSTVPQSQWGLAAPGGAGTGPLENDVFSTHWRVTSVGDPDGDRKYEYMAGTSMAAPHVAGAAALLRSLGLSAQETVDRLLATTKDLGVPGKDHVYGHGRLDVAHAVAGLGGGGGGGGTSGGSGGSGGTTATTRRAGGGSSSAGGTTGNTTGKRNSTGDGGAGSSSAGGPDGGGRRTADGSQGADGGTGSDGNGGQADEDPGVGMDAGLAEGTGPGDGNGDKGGAGDTGGIPWPLAVLGVGALVAVASTVARSARRRPSPAPPG
jgi:subtilisin family serine protease